MEKKHELPEFQVIRQNEANAKFFVASGEDPTPMQSSSDQVGGWDDNQGIDFY